MKNRGQSIVEYLLVFAGIILAVIFVRSQIQDGVENGYGHLKDQMVNAVEHISFGANVSEGGGGGSENKKGGNVQPPKKGNNEPQSPIRWLDDGT